MVNDPEDEVEHTLQGWKFVVRLPFGAGIPVGMCRYRDKLLICTDNGYLYEWDGEREILQQVSTF
jgi:hypothetical protein